MHSRKENTIALARPDKVLDHFEAGGVQRRFETFDVTHDNPGAPGLDLTELIRDGVRRLLVISGPETGLED